MVLVTGAGGGLGRDVCDRCSNDGYRVVATNRDPELLDELNVCVAQALDVTDQATINSSYGA